MTQFNAPTYDIERPSGQCVFTGRTLVPGEAYMSVLIELTADQMAQQAQEARKNKANPTGSAAIATGLGLQRVDVSLEAWGESKRPERMFSYWKSIVAEPNQKKRMFVDDATLVAIFRRLGENDQAERAAFRFVLGLILMRKKLLKYEGMTQQPSPDGAMVDYWKLTPRGEQEPLLMQDLHMDEAKIEQVREQLSEILAGTV